MRWRLIVEDLSPELNTDVHSCLDQKDNVNNTNSNNNNVEPTLESLSENFALNKEDIALC